MLVYCAVIFSIVVVGLLIQFQGWEGGNHDKPCTITECENRGQLIEQLLLYSCTCMYLILCEEPESGSDYSTHVWMFLVHLVLD